MPLWVEGSSVAGGMTIYSSEEEGFPPFTPPPDTIFYQLDLGRTYRYDGEAGKWFDITNIGAAPTEDAASRRAILTQSPSAALDETVYLYRNFSPAGQRKDEYDLQIPFEGGRFACFSFAEHVAGRQSMGRMREGIAVNNTRHDAGGVTKSGTWNLNNFSAPTEMYGGDCAYSVTATNYLEVSVTGHTIILRSPIRSDGGFATVSIDGDFTKANRLPIVTQTEIDLGYFTQGQIGHRYIDYYGSIAIYDESTPLAEGLSDAAHLVRIRVQGTKRAASSALVVYVTAIGAATTGVKPNDSGASVLYTRRIYDPKFLTTSSALVNAPEYAPTSAPTNWQFLGDIHGQETLVSLAWHADGVLVDNYGATRLTAGTYAAGKEITLDLRTTLTHPSVSPTVVARRRLVFSGKGGRSMPLECRGDTTWEVAGAIRFNYVGMLHVGTKAAADAQEQLEFNRALIGDTTHLTSANWSASLDSSIGQEPDDFIAFYSTTHDTVALMYAPRLDLNVNNWLKSSPYYAFIQDRIDKTEKAYFARSTSSNVETVTPGLKHNFIMGWRICRIASAATVLG